VTGSYRVNRTLEFVCVALYIARTCEASQSQE